jgi:putative CocE/NonD family hydrolase
LRVNCYRLVSEEPVPVLLCAHPYGKDRLPRRNRRRSSFSFQYRILRQTGQVRFSTLTSWEAPDPDWWAAQGYAVVNCDLRGAGTSDGVAELLSRQEGEDTYDMIEWAAGQPWSNGKVGMLGVSYLAISQWRPPLCDHRAWPQSAHGRDSPTLIATCSSQAACRRWDSSSCGLAA